MPPTKIDITINGTPVSVLDTSIRPLRLPSSGSEATANRSSGLLSILRVSEADVAAH